MGEAIRGVPGAAGVEPSPGPDSAPPGAPEAEGHSIGAYLLLQRRLRGITLEELADQTRIPLRSLQRLEQGALDGLRDGFVRGFVRTVAGALGLDPEDSVARMLEEPPPSPAVRSSARRRRAVRLAGAGVAAGCVLLVAWLAISGRWPPASDSAGAHTARQGVTLRRDAVRELAIEQGLLPPAARSDPADAE